MSGVAPVSPVFQFLSSAGAPLVSGTVDVYIAGTTTRTTTWQDKTQLTENTNPLVLNARGEATIWFDDSITYKFVLKNAGGVEQYTVDNVPGADSGLRVALAASGGAALLGFLQAGTGAVVRTAQAKLREIVSVTDFGAAGDGSADDAPEAQAAVNTGKDVFFPPGDFRLGTAITATTNSQRIYGCGMAASYVAGSATTQIRASADIEYFRVSGKYVSFDNILFETPTVAHTKPHIRFVNGADSGEVRHCRVNGSGSDGGVGPGITFDDGSGGLGTAVIGLVADSYVVHASIVVRIPDVKVADSWVWTLSKQYGIGVFNGVSNFVADNVDIVPPLSTVTGLKAGVYVSGSSVSPSLVNCYYDGNFALNTGKAVLFENGVIAPSVIGGKANGCDSDVITFDSCIVPTIHGTTFYNNNGQGNGAADIVIAESFAQDTEKPLIQGTMHIQSAAVSGTAGPAVKVAAGVSRDGIRIHNVSIHQPGGGGGYRDEEIYLEDGAFASDLDGTLRGCAGQRRAYRASVSAAYSTSDTTKTLSWPATLAYTPRIDQVRVHVSNSAGGGATPIRIQSVSTSQIVIGFVSGGAPTDGTLFAAVEL